MNQKNDIKQNENPVSKKSTKKRMPVWLLILTDIVLAAVCLGVFSLYQIVLPQKLASAETVVVNESDLANNQFVLPSDDNSDSQNNNTVSITGSPQDAASDNTSGNSDNSISSDKNNKITVTVAPTPDLSTKDGSKKSQTSKKSSKTKKDISKNSDNIVTDKNKTDTAKTSKKSPSGSVANTKNSSKTKAASQEITPSTNSRQVVAGHYTNYGNTGTDSITANSDESSAISSKKKVKTKVNSYKSDNISFTTNKIEIGSGNDKITCYISDIYVTNVKYLKTAFASGTYGKNITESTISMAKDNKALIAISGDYYGNSEKSVVIRNGVLYRKSGNDADVCVLFTNGTMKTYSPDQFDADALIKKGAWQAWTFGPALLNGKGKILKSFNTTDYLYGNQPRSCLGYVKPGHYVFVVVDGRDEGYSRGASLNELAQIMVDAGCVTAYNLDGGKSASMVYDEKYVNQPAQGGREISDIIYIGE